MTLPRLGSEPPADPENPDDPHDRHTAVGDRAGLVEELRRASAGLPAATRKMDAFDLEAALAGERDRVTEPATTERPPLEPAVPARGARSRRSTFVLLLAVLLVVVVAATAVALYAATQNSAGSV